MNVLKTDVSCKSEDLPELLEKHLEYVKQGLPGRAYIRLDNSQPWPD